MRKNEFKRNVLVGFAAGFLSAAVVAAGLFFAGQPAEADQYSCIRRGLDAKGMTGNIPDPEFTITYEVPGCYGSNGYSVARVSMYGDRVAVRYYRD